MFATKRIRLAVAVAASGTTAAMASTASASPKPAAQVSAHHARASLNRFDLNGYVINAKYTLGRNTGTTFQQT
jgi:hypothetical protein